MKPEEAIKMLKYNSNVIHKTINGETDINEVEALDMAISALEKQMPTIEPEQKVERLLPDGTLHLFTDTDLSKVNRVLVSQNGTHYGELYYADGQQKTGKWEIYVISPFDGEGCRCSECRQEGAPYWGFCPNCGTKMEEVKHDER